MAKFRMLHTMLRVYDLDKSIDFYTRLLGMKLLRRNDYEGGRFTLAFVGYGDESDHTVLELTHNWDQKEPYQLGTAYGHIALGVPDIYGDLQGIGSGRRQDPASAGTHAAWHDRDRLHRGPGRLQGRTDRTFVR